MTNDLLRAARERLAFAKRRWTAASQAAIRGDVDAPRLADEALRELNAAREALRRVQAPTPTGAWAMAAQYRDELAHAGEPEKT